MHRATTNEKTMYHLRLCTMQFACLFVDLNEYLKETSLVQPQHLPVPPGCLEVPCGSSAVCRLHML